MTGRTGLRRAAIGAVLALVATIGITVVVDVRPAAATPAVTAIGEGEYHGCALRNGDVFCWGYGGVASIGDGSAQQRELGSATDTTGVLAGLTLTQLSAGRLSNCAVSSAGHVYCWGFNGDGQLGDGTTSTPLSPVATDESGLAGGTLFSQVSVGYDSSCAVTTTGGVYCWGANATGQLGDGTTTGSSVPVAVTGLGPDTVSQISVGDGFACAVTTTNGMYCWGNNGSGQLGNGTTTAAHAATAVSLGGLSIARVTTGLAHTCALTTTGAAYCWGSNSFGQLGDGTNTQRNTPTAVSTSGVLSSVTLARIASGSASYHTCAVSTAGAAYCWGRNSDGQLGDGTNTSRTAPVAVDNTGLLSGVSLVGISTGSAQSCAATVGAAAVYCWGYNGDNELGDTTTNDSTAPVHTLFVPAKPTGVQATGGDQTADVSWTAPRSLGTGTFTRYTATSNPDSHTCQSTDPATTTCHMTGLTNGQAYTFTVVAVASDGTSVASPASGPVTPAAVPADAPTDVTAVPGDSSATVSWTPPGSFGSQAFVHYTVTSSPDSQTCTATTSTDTGCTVPGLTNGTAYIFTVVTTTGAGDSSPSGASPPVTPGAPVAPPSPPAVTDGPLTSSSGADFTVTDRQTRLTGSGFAARTPVTIAIYSTPTVLTRTITDGSGAFSVTVSIPSGFTGSHTLLASGFGAGGVPRTLTLPVRVGTAGGLATTGLPVVATIVIGLGVTAGGLLALLGARRRRSSAAG